VVPKNLNNSVHLGGGIKIKPPLRFIDLDLMTGLHYGNSPSPDNTVDVSAPSFDLIAYHLGARWRMTEDYRLALMYGHYWYLERTTRDSITDPPTNFKGSGYSNMLTLVFEARFGDGIGVN
jgi:long-subunit fatty acid transport protein